MTNDDSANQEREDAHAETKVVATADPTTVASLPSHPTFCLDNEGSSHACDDDDPTPATKAPVRRSLMAMAASAFAPAAVVDVEAGGGVEVVTVVVAAEEEEEEVVAVHKCGVQCAVCERVLRLSDAGVTAADDPIVAATRHDPAVRRSIMLSADSVKELRRKAGEGAASGEEEEGAPPAPAAHARCWSWATGLLGDGGAEAGPDVLGSAVHVWMFGVLVVIGNQMRSWNAGFSAGFGSYVVAQVVTYAGFFAFVCCVGENVATLSFPGGCYGLIRVTTGFYAGAMVGIAKATDLVFRISATVFFVGQTSVALLGCDPSYQVAIWVAFYAFGISTACRRHSTIFVTCAVFFSFSVAVMLMYLFGSLPHVDLAVNGPYLVPGAPLPTAPQDVWFVGGMTAWMTTLAHTAGNFAGLEILPPLTRLIKEPKKNLPHGAAAAMVTLFATNVASTCVAAALPPGTGIIATAGLGLYMSAGFGLMFPSLGAGGAYALVLPALVGQAWAFLVPVGNVLQSLASSNILPRFFMLHGAQGHQKGVIVGCALSFVVNCIAFCVPAVASSLQNVAVFCAVILHFAHIWAHFKVRRCYGRQLAQTSHFPFLTPDPRFRALPSS